jgi:hypothetical protein
MALKVDNPINWENFCGTMSTTNPTCLCVQPPAANVTVRMIFAAEGSVNQGSAVLWIVTPCSFQRKPDVSGEHITHIFRF